MVNAGLSITWKPAAFHLDFLRRPQPFRPAPLTALRSRHSQSSPACHGRMERCNQSQLKAAPQIQSRPDLVNVTSPLCDLPSTDPLRPRAFLSDTLRGKIACHPNPLLRRFCSFSHNYSGKELIACA